MDAWATTSKPKGEALKGNSIFQRIKEKRGDESRLFKRGFMDLYSGAKAN